ncbi:MAG: hypothetical protein K6E46_00485 [Lachnospiraceae bacterium]|nr:hypothetical protein [Lachnospiraceae bacterium]
MEKFMVFINGTGGLILMLGLIVVLVGLFWFKKHMEEKRANSNVRRTINKDKKK